MGLERYRQVHGLPPLMIQEVKQEQRLGTLALDGLQHHPLAMHILIHHQNQQQLEKEQWRHCLKKELGVAGWDVQSKIADTRSFRHGQNALFPLAGLHLGCLLLLFVSTTHK